MIDFTKELKKLNDQQRRAVETIEGPVMVIAGPGTGKTQVVALRIANILQKTQLSASNVLALTFTEAGVTALRKRLTEIIGAEAYRVTVSTFHGFAKDAISTFPHVFAQTQELSQLSDLDRFEVLEKILQDHTNFKLLRPLRKPELYLPEISRALKTCKQESIAPLDIRKNAQEMLKSLESSGAKKTEVESKTRQGEVLLEFAKVYEMYQEAIFEHGWYDYEDMILVVNQALTDNPEIKAFYQERYQYILVDEYQDTNTAQNNLVDRLCDYFENPNLFVVGDDKQAIYRFQGASVANMLHFKNKYPEMEVITLVDNYRSSKNILKTADTLIKNNHHQISDYLTGLSLSIKTDLPVGTKSKVVNLASSIAEMDYIVSRLKDAHKDGLKWSDMAVFWRKNAEVLSFRQLAEKSGLPVSGRANVNLLNTREAQSLLTILNTVVSPNNNYYLYLTAKMLLDATDSLELMKCQQQSYNEHKHLIEILLSSDLPHLKKIATQVLKWNQQENLLTLPELIELLLRDVGTEKIAPSLKSLEVVSTFVRLSQEYSAKNPSSHLKEWLAHLELTKTYNLNLPVEMLGLEEDGIFISTVHGAKGLEFDLVIMAGTDDRQWSDRTPRELIKIPSELIGLKSWHDDAVEDERRLFYVGITRAKKELEFTWSSLGTEGRENLPCQFTTEIETTASSIKKQLSPKDVQKTLVTKLEAQSSMQLHEQELAFIRDQIIHAKFSFTDMMTYQKCPRQYLINRILRFPTLPSPSLVYGNAIHRALELFFKEYKGKSRLPSKSKLLAYYEEAVLNSLPISDQEKQLVLGTAVLSELYDKNQTTWKIPVGVEYSFSTHQVMLGDIQLTGKFDRIESIDASANTVRIIDYKTGGRVKTRGEIEGTTQNSDGQVKKQLVFYSLLGELDPYFRYTAKEFVISFIDDQMKFKEEKFVISEDERKDLKKEIAETYQKIITDDEFPHLGKDFTGGCELCQSVFPG